MEYSNLDFFPQFLETQKKIIITENVNEDSVEKNTFSEKTKSFKSNFPNSSPLTPNNPLSCLVAIL